MSFMLGITPWPAVSATLWIILLVAALYLIRSTAHKTIHAAAHGLHRSFRIASKAVSRSEKNLATRNRDVLLAAGREAKERIIEREFDRINVVDSGDKITRKRRTALATTLSGIAARLR